MNYDFIILLQMHAMHMPSASTEFEFYHCTSITQVITFGTHLPILEHHLSGIGPRLTRDLWHPARSIFAEKLALGW